MFVELNIPIVKIPKKIWILIFKIIFSLPFNKSTAYNYLEIIKYLIILDIDIRSWAYKNLSYWLCEPQWDISIHVNN